MVKVPFNYLNFIIPGPSPSIGFMEHIGMGCLPSYLR